MAQTADTTLRGPTPPAEDDWPTKAADTIERVVGTVRDKSTVPLERVAKLAGYGTLAAILGLFAAVLLAVGLVRLLNVVLPGEVWGAHVVVGGIFTLAGLFLWSKRRTADQK